MSAATELVTVSAVPAASLDDHERAGRPTQTQNEEQEPANPWPRREQGLAPVDGGAAAWKLLCAAFVFEALLWGKHSDLLSATKLPLSFGVFQEYYSKVPEFASNPYVSVVGTIASGLGYLGAPRRHAVGPALPAVAAADDLGRLCVSLRSSRDPASLLPRPDLRVAYGLGFLALYYPILTMVDEYWIARRGMAYGVLCGASGLSGAVMPFALQALLARYGYPTTLRAVVVGLALLTGPFIPLLRGRLPPSQSAVAPTKLNWAFLHNPLFGIYSVADLLQGLGYFFPALYLPSRGPIGLRLAVGPAAGPPQQQKDPDPGAARRVSIRVDDRGGCGLLRHIGPRAIAPGPDGLRRRLRLLRRRLHGHLSAHEQRRRRRRPHGGAHGLRPAQLRQGDRECAGRARRRVPSGRTLRQPLEVVVALSLGHRVYRGVHVRQCLHHLLATPEAPRCLGGSIGEAEGEQQ
ncbi:hypothetical protein PG994_004339 [Apiospora phragmitis]|uniref:Uncharacterized protein n=1 Tax=Apiospora phragmitis TaxID=2905665 RepID=A0ABR1VQB2_9PEZI